MTRAHALVPALAALLGCLPVADSGAEEDLCGASDHRDLIGAPLTNLDELKDTLPNVRIFGEFDPVTQDFVPTRLNIVTREDGTVIRVFCG